jgi:hypothetical protein
MAAPYWSPCEGGMLHVLFGVLLFVGFIALIIGSPAFRMAALIVLALIGIGIYAIVQDDNRRGLESAQRQQIQAAQAAAQWNRVPKSDLFVTTADLNVERGYRELKLDVKNTGTIAVTDIRVSVQLFDCPKEAPSLDSCEQIGDSVETLKGDIPPSQTRQLAASYTFKNEPPAKGRLRWTYHILAIRSQ